MAKKSIEQFKEILNASILDASGLSRTPKPKYYKPRKFILPSATPSTTQSEMAQYMLSGSGNKSVLPAVGTRDGAKTEEPGLLNKIFDAASGPLFGAYDFITEQAENVVDIAQGDLGKVDDLFTQGAESLGRGILRGADSADSIPGVTNFASFLPDSFIKEEAAKKRYGHNILESLGVDNPVAKYGGGFVLDVLADPLTYVPIGGLARTGQKVAKVADQLTQAAATGGKKSNPSAFIKPQIPKVREPLDFTQSMFSKDVSVPRVEVPGSVAPKVDPDFSWGPGDVVTRILNDPDSMNAMRKQKRSDNARRAANIRHGNPPDMLPKATPMTIAEKAAFADRMRGAKLAKQGKVTDGRGHFSLQSVSKVIEDIQNGNISRFGPQAPPATGGVREAAIDIADNFITSNLVGKSKRLDPTTQIKLFETISKSAKGFNSVKSMLRSAEDHMIRLGKHPVYWDGTRVRLSDLLEQAGPKNVDKILQGFKSKDISKADPAVAEMIEHSLARRAMTTSDLVMNISNYVVRAKEDILSKYNPGKARPLLESMPQQAADAIKAFGLTEEEANKVRDLVRNILDADAIPTEKLMEELGPRLTQAAVDGRLDVKTYNKIIKSIQKTIGETPENLAKSVTGNKAIDTFILAFSTNMGRGDMKKFADGAFAYREANAVNRARWFRNIVEDYNAEEINNAFWVAQNLRDRSTVSPKVAQLSDKITEYFENMLGSSRFTDLKDFEGTTAIKSRLVMADVNKQLKNIGSKFFFINHKAKNNLGVPRDYSEKGIGWLKSWENANPKKIGQDPVAFMYDLDLAIERTVAEYSLLDSFATHFGATRFDKHFNSSVHNTQLGHHRLEGYYFPKEQQQQMIRLLHDLDENIWKPNNQMVRFYSRGLRAWKTGVTIYLPSHHIRNLIGDLHLMWWAGHNDPRNFTRARRVMHAQRGKYQEALKSDTLDALKGLIDADAMRLAATKGGDTILSRNGVTLNADQLYVGAYQRGLLLDANKLEDIFGDSPLSKIGERGSALNKIVARPLRGKAHRTAASAAEYREHYVRLSHFIGAVNKNLKKTKDINKAMDDAAAEVRKWHPDGRDLTQFEQKLRYIIPFYSWTRKAFPLVVQAAVQRPAKVLYYPRSSVALQGMLGVEAPDGVLDPFPDDQLFPDWIRERGIGPIGDPTSDNFVSSWWGKLGQNTIGVEGQETGYTIVNPSNPFQDLISETFGMGTPKGLLQGIGNTLTPAFKIPAELIMNRNMLGIPISGEEQGGMGYANYAAQQIPVLSAANNVAEIDLNTMKPKEVKPGREGGPDFQALINYLTALGLRGTGPFQKTAEFEAKARAQQ